MKSNSKNKILLCVGFVVLIALTVFFSVYEFKGDKAFFSLLSETIVRLLELAIIVIGLFVLGYGYLFKLKTYFKTTLLFCLPCALVVVANFPVYALATGGANIVRWDILWLLILDCALIGLTEELIFRGVVQSLIYSKVKQKRNRAFFTVLYSALVFSAFHLLNIFSGNVLGTLMQLGYTFLLGGMLSAIMYKTRSIWACVIIHALFDLGGMIVPVLGSGNFQDLFFWIATAVGAVVCAVHVVLWLVKECKKG